MSGLARVTYQCETCRTRVSPAEEQYPRTDGGKGVIAIVRCPLCRTIYQAEVRTMDEAVASESLFDVNVWNNETGADMTVAFDGAEIVNIDANDANGDPIDLEHDDTEDADNFRAWLSVLVV